MATTKVQVTRKSFDFADLDGSIRLTVRSKTTEIRDRVGRASQNIIEIGQRLLDVKDMLDHGQFTLWLDSEFAWSESAATKMMQVATSFKSVNFTDLQNIAPSALYLLAAPSTPEKLRTAAMKKAGKGEKVTHKEVKAAVENAKPTPSDDGQAAGETDAGKDAPPAASPQAEDAELAAQEARDLEVWQEGSAFRAEGEAIVSTLRSVRIRMAKWVGYDAQANKTTAHGANFLSASATVWHLDQLIRQIEDGIPAAADQRPPGYLSAGIVKDREKHAKQQRKSA